MPLIGGGGVEKNLSLIINYVSKKMNNVHLCTFLKKNKKKLNKNIKLITPDLKLSKNSGKIIQYLFCAYALFKFLLKNKNSIVFSFQANIYCIITCKILNIKIISRSNASPIVWANNFIKKFLFKKIYKLSNLIVVNSKDFQKQMLKMLNLKTTYIYNPLNKNQIFEKSKIKIKENFFLGSKSLKIINVGRLTDQKDQITILKSINLIKNQIPLKVMIIGKGYKEKELLNYIKENKLQKIVKIKNYTENPYSFIRKADLFILSSKYEGLPNVLLEAATLKKFIISSNCSSGPSEILKGGKYGFLFQTSNYNNLAKKILLFQKMNIRKKIKITNSLYNSLERFNYKRSLNEYLQIIKKIN